MPKVRNSTKETVKINYLLTLKILITHKEYKSIANKNNRLQFVQLYIMHKRAGAKNRRIFTR